VTPKETFNAVRWADFKSVAAQKRLSQVLPNTVTLTPIKKMSETADEPTLPATKRASLGGGHTVHRHCG
jgi:hypothetical protein